MSVTDKVIEIKKIISMICDLFPVVVQIVKEVLILVKDIKTV